MTAPTHLREDRAALVWRWAIVLGAVGVLQALVSGGVLDPVIVPAPTDIGDAVWSLIRTDEFASDIARTAIEVATACMIGVGVGLVVGAVAARVRLFADTIEPYLVTFYAVPTLVFYPILLAIMGLGSGPIATIAATMVVVPVALNTMVALRSVNPVLRKLASSLSCTGRQLYQKVLLPAAVPMVISGIKLGVMYGIIGTIAMEFILANSGVGYRIGYRYNNFQIVEMWANIVIVVGFSVLVVAALGVVERRVRRDGS